MRIFRVIVCLTALVLLTSLAAMANVVGYTLDVTTSYAGSLPPGTLTPFGGPSPDTGFWTITNSGSSTFTGTVGQETDMGGGANFDFTSGALTLAPGQSINVAVNFESSNQGGYNGPTGTLQNGVQININGLINGTEAINLSVFDKDIHSGVTRSANGHPSDSYVLQGGDPFGGDTGDGFEETQASGHFRFFEAPTNVVPEPGSMVLFGSGLAGVAGILRRKLRK